MSEAGKFLSGIWATIYIIVLTYAAKPKMEILWGPLPKKGKHVRSDDGSFGKYCMYRFKFTYVIFGSEKR